jgi:hypothetical protein
LTETGSSSDTQTNIFTTAKSIIETGSSSDTQTNIFTTAKSIIETGSSSDAQSNVFVTNQFIIETANVFDGNVVSLFVAFDYNLASITPIYIDNISVDGIYV